MSLLFEAKFPTGRVVITPAASDLLEKHKKNPLEFIERHVNKDWGDVSEADGEENDFSVDNQLRIMSVYRIEGEKIYIITEADRSVTTILLPEDY